MKIIRCTKKLLDELRMEPVENPESNNWLESWHANIFTVAQRKCVLITNDATLYSLLFLGLLNQAREGGREGGDRADDRRVMERRQ